MRHQSSSGREARLMLPLVLHLLQAPSAPTPGPTPPLRASPAPGADAGSIAAARAAFAAGWRGVPLGALLPWAGQMLSRLGEGEGEVLAAPLEELGRW
jgi:hypothetical protein